VRGFHFTRFDPNEDGKSRFDQLLDLFMQLLTYTSGDVSEALQWLNELDKKYQLTDDEYGMGDFLEELKEKGYITEDNQRGEIKITPKTEQGIRKKSLDEIFGKLKQSREIIIVSNPDKVMSKILKQDSSSLVTCWSKLILLNQSGMHKSITV
jgi:Ca-activated chloride channel homolog